MIIRKIDKVSLGEVLGKTIYGNMGELLLRKGTSLTQFYIEKLKKLGYNTIYIDDGEDIEVEEVINEELRMKTVKAVKNIMTEWKDDRYSEIEDLVNNIIDSILMNKKAMIEMIDLRTYDSYTFYHCVNVAVLSMVIGISMSKNRNEIYELGIAAVLHDIGKTKVPINVLNKPGKLTDDEFEEIKQHSINGYEILKGAGNVPVNSYMGVLDHHERYDGSGYPNAKSKEQIHEYGRIICIADVYDALISDRPYRSGMPTSEVIEYIMANSSIIFDPTIVDYFLKKVAPYAIGECVNLSNGKNGVVVKNNSDCCLRPKIKLENGLIIDLADKKWLNVTIVNTFESLKYG